MEQNKEFERFDHTMEQLLRVPDSEIKAKLEAEKSKKRQGRIKVKDRDKSNQNTD
jgi:hypothetical protein